MTAAGRSLVASAVAGIVVVVLIASMGSCGDRSPRPPRAPDYDLNARSVCKDFVRERLVAPRTAEFQNVFEFQVRKLSDLEFIVVGQVDAQNRLGATARSTFKCQVRREANADSWMPVDVIVTER